MTSTCTINLDHEQLLILDAGRGTRVRVVYGGLWLTGEGDPDDYSPRSGDEVSLRGRGRLLVQAMGATRIELFEAIRCSPRDMLTRMVGRWLRLASEG